MSVSAELRLLLAERDKNRCAYCLTSEENCGLRMHVDHIKPETAGGKTTLANLCLACFSCNVHKGATQQRADPLTRETVFLFHPLRQNWNDHFCWDERRIKIIGLTPCGRATILTLQMNNSTVVKARHRWVSAGWHPPVL
ncbi:HNH endonuclease signature motif containing protein [Desulfococcaceae bacterium HSG9]|nr:HNH endonuclease signature motif containing protein [Desulfococcaceae bacterium HSG9]